MAKRNDPGFFKKKYSTLPQAERAVAGAHNPKATPRQRTAIMIALSRH